MKANPLVVAIVVLAALGGLVYYSEKNPPASDDDRPTLVKSEEKNIRRVTVRKAGAEPIVVERGEDGKWRFGGGLTVPADDSAIGLMAANLSRLEAERAVEEQVEDWTPYGLAGEGEISVEVEFAEGEPKKLVFGAGTPTGSGVFARIEGDPRLYTVYNYVKATFDKTVYDWRDKRLLRVDADKVSRVRVRTPKRSFELGRAGERNWHILEPAPMRADAFSAGDLARAVQDAQMTAVASETGEFAGANFTNPVVVAEVVDEAGAHTLTIAKAGDAYYARSSDLPGVYEVSSTLAESLDKDVADLRNKKLFDFGFSGLSRVKVRAGEKNALLERKDDAWRLSGEDREVDSEKAQTLIDALRNLTATAFPSDNAAEHGRFGLAAPYIEAEATPTGDDAKTEKVVVSDPERDRVYAARSGEPSVYQIEQSAAREIVRALDAVLTPPPAAEGESKPAGRE